jgi:hypothetical protein
LLNDPDHVRRSLCGEPSAEETGARPASPDPGVELIGDEAPKVRVALLRVFPNLRNGAFDIAPSAILGKLDPRLGVLAQPVERLL